MNDMNSHTLNAAESKSLDEFLDRGPYVGYTYSYPHKTAYRPLPTRSLQEVWQGEPTNALFLYVHVPFCEFRCGFCNLFTISQPDQDLPQQYLKSFQRQARQVKEGLPKGFRFAQLAIGGGTPSYLNIDELEQLFGVLSTEMHVDGNSLPLGMEVSPATVDGDKLRLMKDFGVDRVSMGVQSFNGRDVGAIGRPQKLEQVFQAIELIRSHCFKTLNLDLIYGAEGQTVESWLQSVNETIELRPEEIFLYPLYVRQLTGLLKRKSAESDDRRLELYRAGRDRLLESGYEQVSMRMFRLPINDVCEGKSLVSSDYRCQRDGMIGLGCGARSYTSDLHYGSRYAVRQSAVSRIVTDYVSQTDREFSEVSFGFEIDDAQRRRRHLILSLFLTEGLSLSQYRDRFSTCVRSDFPQLSQLIDCNLATIDDECLRLSDEGIAWSDSIGPWLYSNDVDRLMQEYQWQQA
jgi:oxygen-independent coproporphyrinogen-3 oxidase